MSLQGQVIIFESIRGVSGSHIRSVGDFDIATK